MRLSTRTAIAAGLAAAVSLTVLAVLFRNRVYDTLRERVDRQLEQRAGTAPILAAVGARLATSELGATVDGARIVTTPAGGPPGPTISIGNLPTAGLPAVDGTGWKTVRADGQAWRLYTIAVDDVPGDGDVSLVELAAPLGDVDALARRQRRQSLLLAVAAVAASAAVGYGLGMYASAPLGRLRRAAGRVGAAGSANATVRIPEHLGAVEVDEIAAVLNAGLDQVASTAAQREGALASARAFAAAAGHELRTPLTGALTNLELAAHPAADTAAALAAARVQVRRASDALGALRRLADADLADPSWFAPYDIADQVAVLVAAEARRHPGVRVRFDAAGGECDLDGWAEGIELAVGNLIRNALLHGRPADPRQAEIAVGVACDPESVTITVDDNGPGIPPEDRARLVRRFERGEHSTGQGLGLALAEQIAALHGGRLVIGTSPAGGARLVLTLGRRPPGKAQQGVDPGSRARNNGA